MKSVRRWILWKLEPKADGKPSKIPYCIDGGKASTTDPATWSLLEEAQAALENGSGYAGLGFVLGDGFSGIDLDHCINDEGNILPSAFDVIRRINSYSEFSPSGLGIHILFTGDLPPNIKHKKLLANEVGFEIYGTGRYFTVTGNTLEAFRTIQKSDIEGILTYLDMFIKPPAPSAPPCAPATARVDSGALERRASAYLARMQPSVSGKGGHDDLFKAVQALMRGFLMDEATARRLIDVEFNPRCQPPWTPREIDHKFDESAKKPALKPDGWLLDNPNFKPPEITEHEATESNQDENQEDIFDIPSPGTLYTDVANSRRYARKFYYDARYCPALGWLSWDGQRWSQDKSILVEKFGKKLADDEMQKAMEIEDRDMRETQMKKVLNLQSKTKIDHMISLAKSDLIIDSAILDNKPFLLNAKNGTVNLEDGTLHPHDRDDFLTKITDINFEPDAEAPRWLSFLFEIFDGNQNMIDFFQRLIGYCSTGDCSEECLPIWHGSGQNGKGTSQRIIMAILGEYATTAPKDLIFTRNKGSTPETEIADLKGRRFVAIGENERRRHLNEGLVKWITGRDRLKGRALYKDFIEFEPTHKIVLSTNFKPTANGDDNGIWRRLKLVPFTVTIPEDQKIPDLDRQLITEEAAGILNWIVKGAVRWRHDGLKYPETVTKATESYRRESDSFREFFDECLELNPPGTVKIRELRTLYQNWCEDNGKYCLSIPQCNATLLEYGLAKTHRSGGDYWIGIILKQHLVDNTTKDYQRRNEANE
jgi:putative DNA primase/helicase